jgi:ppGpp synthetase/RelA/SpoT-type nucleotidyltranferase
LSEEVVDQLSAQFAAERPKFEAFTDSLRSTVLTLLRHRGLDYSIVESRTKELKDFDGKIRRDSKSGKYKHLSDITDLSGLRIVAHDIQSAEKICSLICDNFLIDVTNSSDRRSTIEADRFGYLSVHYIISYDKRRQALPENQQFAGIKAEVQVRTVLQHAWAVLDRRLRYNNEEDIPRQVRRKLFRISALLEVADETFAEIASEVSALRSQYKDDFAAGELGAELNLDSLEIFYESSQEVAQLLERAASAGARAQSRSPSENGQNLIPFLKDAGLNTIQDVQNALREFLPHAPTIFSRFVVLLDNWSPMIGPFGLIRFATLFRVGKATATKLAREYLPDGTQSLILRGTYGPPRRRKGTAKSAGRPKRQQEA